MNPQNPAILEPLDLRTLSANGGETPVVRIAPGETLVAFAVPEFGKPISCRFELAEGARLFLRSLVRPGTSAEVAVFLLGDRSEADIRAVAVSEADKPSTYSSRTVSTASGTRAYSDVAAFSMSGGDLSVTTVAEIGEGVFGAYAEAVQSNVLFGNSGKVRGIPELHIGSDDVKARHSCSVERFSDEKLFYLRSRGLSESDAVASLVAAKTSSAFSGLPENFVSLSENLCQSAISVIVSAESSHPSQG